MNYFLIISALFSSLSAHAQQKEFDIPDTNGKPYSHQSLVELVKARQEYSSWAGKQLNIMLVMDYVVVSDDDSSARLVKHFEQALNESDYTHDTVVIHVEGSFAQRGELLPNSTLNIFYDYKESDGFPPAKKRTERTQTPVVTTTTPTPTPAPVQVITKTATTEQHTHKATGNVQTAEKSVPERQVVKKEVKQPIKQPVKQPVKKAAEKPAEKPVKQAPVPKPKKDTSAEDAAKKRQAEAKAKQDKLAQQKAADEKAKKLKQQAELAKLEKAKADALKKQQDDEKAKKKNEDLKRQAEKQKLEKAKADALRKQQEAADLKKKAEEVKRQAEKQKLEKAKADALKKQQEEAKVKKQAEAEKLKKQQQNAQKPAATTTTTAKTAVPPKTEKANTNVAVTPPQKNTKKLSDPSLQKIYNDATPEEIPIINAPFYLASNELDENDPALLREIAKVAKYLDEHPEKKVTILGNFASIKTTYDGKPMITGKSPQALAQRVQCFPETTSKEKLVQIGALNKKVNAGTATDEDKTLLDDLLAENAPQIISAKDLMQKRAEKFRKIMIQKFEIDPSRVRAAPGEVKPEGKMNKCVDMKYDG